MGLQIFVWPRHNTKYKWTASLPPASPAFTERADCRPERCRMDLTVNAVSFESMELCKEPTAFLVALILI